MKVLGFLVLLALVASCTKLEQENDVPGGDLPPVTSSQLGVTGASAGAMGDLVNYIGTQDQSLKKSNFTAKKDFRKSQRDQLRASILEQACEFKKSSDDKNFSMTGEGCAVRIKTQNNVIEDGNVNGNYTLQSSNNMDFVARNNLVASEIHDFTLNGNQVTEIRYEGELYNLKRKYNVQADVMTKTLGDFVYTLDVNSRRTVNFSSNSKENDLIERTDRLKFSGFEVVLYYKYEFIKDEPETRDYYINGQSLDEEAYLSILQDLNTQLGLSDTFDKSKTSEFDPFN